jgi:hypothetical protein
MADPVEQSTVECPSCGCCFVEWTPPAAVELGLGCDPQLADPGFLGSAVTATCPQCGRGVRLGRALPAEHTRWPCG